MIHLKRQHNFLIDHHSPCQLHCGVWGESKKIKQPATGAEESSKKHTKINEKYPVFKSGNLVKGVTSEICFTKQITN